MCGSWPDSLTITGKLDGKPFHTMVPIANVAVQAGHLPRTWAKLEIDRLLAENPETNKNRIVELSKAMYVMTPFTSLLVLENEDMYKRFNVDRGRKDHWAMYACAEKIPVVYEPQGTPATPAAVEPTPAPSGDSAPAPAVPAKAGRTIKSPTPGTFYTGPNPEAPPFVSVGSRVTPTTVVCIIEAMKIFNEIQAECSGVITKVLVQNQQPVEYDQPLFEVDPTG